MMKVKTKLNRSLKREKRHGSLRQKIKGTPERPRLCVFRSLKHIYAQVIDDQKDHTLVQASSLDPAFKGQDLKARSQKMAQEVGKLLAQRALEASITQVVFDRAGYKYHGKVKALAEGARQGGLKF